jgi:hypothetical protein
MTMRSAVLVLLFAGAISVKAQEAPRLAAAPVDSSAVALQARLAEAQRERWRLRLTLVDDRAVTGQIQSITGERIELQSRRILLPDIRKLERESISGGGGRAGFIIGTLVGSALTYTAVAGLEEGSNGVMGNPAAVALTVVFGGLIGGVPGSLIGSAVSPATVAWLPVWP